jgi:hypothetical protein
MSDLLTVSEVAALLKVSEETVTRRFAGVKGVIDIGTPETPRKRRYRVLRIPRSVVEKYVLSKGGRVTLPDTPTQPVERGRPQKPKHQPTEDELARDLAALAQKRGTAARKFVEKIAERARLMTFVPSEAWESMVWFDEEDV